MTDNKTAYTRMKDARERDANTNGRVIKPFKSQHGASELFSNNELVSVGRVETEQKGEFLFVVTGVSFEMKTQTFNMKSAVFADEEALLKYVKITGEVVEVGPSKPQTFQTKFEVRGKFKSLNEIEIPRGTVIVKTNVIQGGGLLEERIEAVGFEDAIIDSEKLGVFCKIIEPQVEITESE